MNQKLRLNLGCGDDLIPGYINIDARPQVHPDQIWDLRRPLPYPDESVSEIKAFDILEHLTLKDQENSLREMYRLLSVNGRIQIRIPNPDDIISRFNSDPATRNLFLYGDTRSSGKWGVHKTGHTPVSFKALALYCGFRPLKFKAVDTNWIIELEKTIPPVLQKLTFINQTLGMGGAESFNSDLLHWLHLHDVHVTAYTNFIPFIRLLAERQIPVYRTPVVIDIVGNWKGILKAAFLWPFAVFYFFRIVIRERRSDLILMTGFIEKILVTPIACLLSIPVVWIEFGPLHPLFSKFWGLPEFLYRLVSDMPDAVIVPTNYTARSIIPSSGISSAKLEVIPCARNVIPPRSIPVTPLSVYCVSRLEPGKGQDWLIRSWELISKQVPDARLYIVGEGDFLPLLKNLVSELHLENSVQFSGRVKDAIAEMAKAEVVVFPSVWSLEGFGIVTAEAMALGKPIVAFRAGPTPELIDDQTAVLVPAEDIKAMADAVTNLLLHPQIGKNLGLAARKRYLQKFTFQVIGPKYQSSLLKAVCLSRAKHM